MNNEYKYYVFNTIDNLIFSGWEFKEDSIDSLKEVKEVIDSNFKIYTKSYLENNLKINTNNLNNWGK